MSKYRWIWMAGVGALVAGATTMLVVYVLFHVPHADWLWIVLMVLTAAGAVTLAKKALKKKA